jgi:hypothetical protein
VGDHPKVNCLPLPPQLVALIEAGRWRHPGDEVLKSAVPFQGEPVDFLAVEAMRRESCGALADNPQYSASFHMVRGRTSAAPVDLPWLDADLAVFIAVNRFPGDDLAIALDYRTSSNDPRVVASEWLAESGGCIWREVAGSFTKFAQHLRLCGDA